MKRQDIQHKSRLPDDLRCSRDARGVSRHFPASIQRHGLNARIWSRGTGAVLAILSLAIGGVALTCLSGSERPRHNAAADVQQNQTTAQPTTQQDVRQLRQAPLAEKEGWQEVKKTAAQVTASALDGIRLCQCLGPAAPHPIWGVDSLAVPRGEPTWDHRGYIDWQAYAQGEYVGHFRTPHIPEYRYRVDDQIEFRYRRTRERTNRPYRIQVGDVLSIASFTDQQIADAQAQNLPNVQASSINQPQTVVQPDGAIIMPLIGAVPAAGRTILELRNALEKHYEEYYRVPAITVTPISTNTKLQDILDAVDARFGQGGQRILVIVSPDGTVQLPGLGSVYVQGLTDDEVKREVDERYDTIVEGIEVTPVLSARAPRFIYVVGEVGIPGQYPLTGPTTVSMAIAMAGGYNGLNANLRQVVIFRRGDDWRLMATMLDIQGGMYGRRPCPADEIWLNDSDIVIVPKTPLNVTNEWIEQVFTRGIYSVFPLNFSSFTNL